MNNISSYFEDIGTCSRLEKSDESRLFEEYKKTKNLKIRNRIIESNLGLVVSIAKKFNGRGVPFIDLINEGNTGLIISIDKFDNTKSVPFSAYARWWIRYKIRRATRNQTRVIELPCHVFDRHNKAVKNNRTYDIPDMSYVSLDICDDTLISNATNPAEKVMAKSDKKRLAKIFVTLSDVEKLVLKLHFGLEDNPAKDLREIGKILKITGEGVRQIELKAINKLKKLMR
jgi:RNA polymerase primary sigma factor